METSEDGFLNDNNDGTVHSAYGSGEVTSDYIPVSEGDRFIIQTLVNSTDATSSYGSMIYYMWFSDRTPESHIGTRNDYHRKSFGLAHDIIVTDPAPADAKYIRVSTRFYKDGIMKIERGNIWIPNSLENQ